MFGLCVLDFLHVFDHEFRDIFGFFVDDFHEKGVQDRVNFFLQIFHLLDGVNQFEVGLACMIVIHLY